MTESNHIMHVTATLDTSAITDLLSNEIAAINFQDRVGVLGYEQPVTLKVSLSVSAGRDFHPTWGSQFLGHVAKRIQELAREELKALGQLIEAQSE